MVSLKEWSEIAKNIVSTLAVIVGGVWVLYQWDTLFPKTRADVQTAAATVRTDVSGSFTVQLGLQSEEVPFKAPAGTDESIGLVDFCTANPGAGLVQAATVFGQLTLKSASAIPVRARVERIGITAMPLAPPSIAVARAPVGRAQAVSLQKIAVIDDPAIFIGGLRENRVEKDQEVRVPLMFSAEIPVRCDQLERLVLFRSEVALTAIDPVTDKPVGTPAIKVFASACQLNPRTPPVCNVEGLEALGQ